MKTSIKAANVFLLFFSDCYPSSSFFAVIPEVVLNVTVDIISKSILK